MKTMIKYIILLLVAVLSFIGCHDDSIGYGNKEEAGSLRVYFTTPALEQSRMDGRTRGTHTEAEAKAIEDKVEQLYLMVFDQGAKTGY